MNDNIWSDVGKGMANKLLRGLGFKNLAEFNTFVRTGKKSGPDTHHGGGEIGSGGSGRGNIPEGRGGLHRSEVMVRAQKGEYIVNKTAAQKNMSVLRAINSGNLVGRPNHAAREGFGPGNPREGLGGPFDHEAMPFNWSHYAGPAGFTMGVNSRMFGRGFQQAGQNAYQVGLDKQRAREQRERRRQRGDNRGGPMGVGPTGPVTDLGRYAIQWAQDHPYTNPTTGRDWANQCLSAVRQSLKAPGGVYDAIASWNGVNNKYSASNYSSIPAGVPVFWNTGSNGHVILSAGGGRAYGTDNRVNGQYLATTISDVANWLGTPPVGWGGDINGKHVYPELRKGGTVRYDNTLVNAHKGETMLTAPLTNKFKSNVAAGGGDEYNVTIDLRGAYIKENVDIEKAVNTAIEKKNTRLGRKRVVN
jgi:hypothetical protein